MREREIHPAVLVEIERNNSDSWRKIRLGEINCGKPREPSFARIQVNRSTSGATSENKIDGAVIVEVRGDDAGPGRVDAKAGFLGNIGEGGIAVVAPQCVFASFSRGFRRHAEVQIEVAVMVVINKGGGDAALFASNSDFFGYVDKFAAAVIVKKANASGFAHGQIGPSIVVEIAGGAPKAGANSRQAGFFSSVRELAVSQIAQQVALPFPGTDEKQIGLAVAVIVEKTGAAARADGCGGAVRQELRNRGRCVMHGDLRESARVSAVDKFGKREFSLVTVTGAEGGSKMFGGQFLEVLHPFAGRFGLALALVGARETKLRRSVIRGDGQRLLECDNGVVVLLEL